MATGIEDPEKVEERYIDYYALDVSVTPAVPMFGMLGWTGAAWEKVESDGSGNLKVVSA